MIRVPPGAVILDAGEVDYVSRALAEFASTMAPRSPSPKLLAAIENLRRAGASAALLASADLAPDHRKPGNRQPENASARAIKRNSGQAVSCEDIGTAEAARRLGITPNGVRDLVRRGRLVGRRTGGRWMVDAASLDAHAARTAARCRG